MAIKKKNQTKQKTKNVRLHEFRKYDDKKGQRYYKSKNNRDSRHINYVYERKNDRYYYLSITHSPPKNDAHNYRQLTHSVDKNDHKPAYINTISQSTDYRTMGKRYKDYEFHPNDKALVRNIIKKNRKRKK